MITAFPLVAALALQAASGPVPWQPPPVTSDRFESHPAFDPVTGDVYFVRSSPQFTGWKMLVSRCGAGERAAAEPATFSGEGVEADPFFTADGRRFLFISSRRDPPAKTSEDLDIWMAERDADGRWGAPMRLPAPVNSPAEEWFPRLDADGVLHFGSGRPGGFGETDIYRAVRAGDGWAVTNVGGSVSTADNDYEFEPARDGRFAVLMSGGALYRLERNGEGWGERRRLETGASGFHVGPLLSPSGRTLMFAAGLAGHSGEIFSWQPGESEPWPPPCPITGAGR